VARGIWNGAISLGLAAVPVKLYPATEQKDIQFHQFKEGTKQRIRYKRVGEQSGRGRSMATGRARRRTQRDRTLKRASQRREPLSHSLACGSPTTS